MNLTYADEEQCWLGSRLHQSQIRMTTVKSITKSRNACSNEEVDLSRYLAETCVESIYMSTLKFCISERYPRPARSNQKLLNSTLLRYPRVHNEEPPSII